MKLYVKKGNKKIYLRYTANSRAQLAYKIGSPNFNVNGISYNVNRVYAEKESSETIIGGVVGGVIGLLGGPVGFITGAAIGGLIGNSSERKEEEQVKYFNRSRYL